MQIYNFFGGQSRAESQFNCISVPLKLNPRSIRFTICKPICRYYYKVKCKKTPPFRLSVNIYILMFLSWFIPDHLFNGIVLVGQATHWRRQQLQGLLARTTNRSWHWDQLCRRTFLLFLFSLINVDFDADVNIGFIRRLPRGGMYWVYHRRWVRHLLRSKPEGNLKVGEQLILSW